MRVFAIIPSECDGATFTQIHQKFRIAKAILIFAQRHGGAWVIITPEKDKYYLGLRLYELGNKAAEQYDIKKSRYRF